MNPTVLLQSQMITEILNLFVYIYLLNLCINYTDSQQSLTIHFHVATQRIRGRSRVVGRGSQSVNGLVVIKCKKIANSSVFMVRQHIKIVPDLLKNYK